MNRLWDIVIRPCLELSGAKNIVEIGSDTGKGTKNLIEYCTKQGGQLISIDPLPGFDYRKWEEENEGVFKLYQELSLERLPLLKDYDAILIDGDHNWYTVYHELKVIKEQFGKDNLPLIFFHDMLWPYAKRDLYYAPENIPPKYRHEYAQKGILPGENKLVDQDGLNAHLYNAVEENTPQNGVRTAVEDFITEIKKDDLNLTIIPAFYGVGVLTDGRNKKVRAYLESYETAESVNRLLESNRTELTIAVNNIKEARDTYRERVIELKESVNEKNEQIKVAKVKNEQLTKESQQVHQQNKKLAYKNKELNERYSQFKEQYEGLKEQYGDMKTQYNELKEQYIAFKEQYNELKGHIEEQKRYISAQKDYIRDQKEIIATHTEFKNQLTSKLDALNRENAQLKNRIKEKDRRIYRLKTDCDIHLNSVRYKLGDTLIKAMKPSVDTVKAPVKIARLLKEGIAKNKERATMVVSEQIPQPTIVNKIEKVVPIVKEDIIYHKFNFSRFEEEFHKQQAYKINIIVAIYNAYDEVVECIESVLNNTDFPYRLILIDDCSPDERIRNLLSGYETHENIEVIYNEQNMGYVNTVNKGIELTQDGDVVLLNSDTKVERGWLHRLVIAALQDAKVGTVTPFSNAAGAFSVPELGKNEEIPDYLTLPIMQNIVHKNSKFDYVEVPTGNGFCIYIKRALIKEIGLFDAQTFSRGYGEENDFCMRALKNGWKNIIDDATYIYHKRSASFSSEKEQLIKENRAKLDALHPDYTDKIKVFRESQQLINIRERIQTAMNSFADNYLDYSINKNILYVLHEGAGGTPNTNKDLMNIVSEKNYTTYVLTSNGKVLKLSKYQQGELKELRKWTVNCDWDINRWESDEHKDIYFDVLVNLKIDVVHIRHLFKHTFDIVNVAKTLNLPVIMSFHDFYYICPTIHLLDTEGKYCEGNCCKDKTNCFIPSGMIKIEGNVASWVQQIWKPKINELLAKCDAFVTTSIYSKELHIKAYPMLAEQKFYSIEHGRDFEYDKLNPMDFYDDQKIKILLPGNIDFHKGSKFLADLIEFDVENKLEFHVIGKVDHYLKDKVIDHGPYERHEFLDLVQKIQPNFIGIISIWPETYCHTLSEAWSCGIPTIVSDIGTLRERGLNGGCILIDHTDIEDTYSKIVAHYEKDRYQLLCKEVQEIQMRSTRHMAREYIKLYKLLQSGEKPNEIYIYTKGKNGKYPPSGNIRVVAPIINNPLIVENSYIEIDQDMNHVLCSRDVASNVYILIQRDSLNELQVEQLKDLKQAHPEIKVVFEIDDNILGIDDKHPEYEQYKPKIILLKEIYKIADKVITTSPKIIEAYDMDIPDQSQYVIPNFIDERIWLSPVLKKTERKQTYEIVKICYIGSMTHTNDLMFLEEVVKALKDTCNKKIEFYIVGGTTEQKDWFKTIKIPKNSTHYPDFVKWLRGIERFDIAIAPLNLENELNYAKSYLKYLEYGIMDMAGIYTQILPFEAVIKDGENGRLIEDNDSEKWVEALRKYIEDIAFREENVQNAKTDILNNHLLKDNLYRWKEVFIEDEGSL